MLPRLFIPLSLGVCVALASATETDTRVTSAAPSEQAASFAPPAVLAAAQHAVPDVQLRTVEAVWEHDSRVYKFTGTRFLVEYRIFVRSDSTLLRIEKNNLDDD